MPALPVNQQITSGTRLGAMFLDHLFMTMIAMAFSIPGMVVQFAGMFTVTHDQPGIDLMGGSWAYLSMLGYALYFCKDSINGRSIAKRILKLQVVDNTTGEPAGPLKCFIRNLFVVIWPVEGIIALINTRRRLGDRVAGTKLVVFEPSQEETKVNVGQTLISVGLAYAFVLLLFLPFKGLFDNMGSMHVHYKESSYNDQLSKEAEQLFSDNLGQHLTASIRAYGQVDNTHLKYVSVIFQLKENYLDNDDSFEEIKSLTTPLLQAKFPDSTYMGQVKYVYKTSGRMQTRIIPLN